MEGEVEEELPEDSLKCRVDLSELIPMQEWLLYHTVIQEAKVHGLPFALGGGLAFSAYSARQRNTKDVDLFILPSTRDKMISILTNAGFSDYYEQLPYDREWIYRGYSNGVILDLIWQMANKRAEVDDIWLAGGREVMVHGVCLKLLPVEELIWAKLYVLQRDRCDWPDILNILYAEGRRLNWERLFGRVGDDVFVLGGVMSVFRWLCPIQACELPLWIWERMGLNRPPDPGSALQCHRAPLLDTRDWFGPSP